MNRHAFQPRALVLAAATVLAGTLAGCGGGDALPPGATPLTPAPDTTPPTLTITSSAAGSTARGPVTFEFVFSENVGTSFDTDDIVVTGGSAGTFTRISGTKATLVVTPNAASTGTVQVSVGAGRYADLANNANATTASASQAYDTVAVATGTGSTGNCTAAPCVDFSAAGYALVPFGGIGASIAADPGDAANPVLQLVKPASAETWAGATLDPSGSGAATVPAFGFATSKIVTLRVLAPEAGETIMLKVESAADATVYLEAQAKTTKAGQWETLTFDFGAPTNGTYAAGKTYDRVSVFPHFGSKTTTDAVYLFDELKYAAAAAAPVGCGTTAPTCAPTTTIPTGAKVIYSDAEQVAGFNPKPDWGQSPPVTYTEETIAGNKSLKYGFSPGALYEGLDWAANPVDVSGKGKLHLDLWSANVSSVKISIISAGKENAVTQAVTAGSWNSVDIDLAQFPVPDKSAIIQIKIEPATAGTLYVDNIYFWGTPAGASSGPVTFSSGFAGSNLTVEGGKFGSYAGSSLDGWNCSGDPAWCGSGGAFAPAEPAATSSFYAYYQTPSAVTGLYNGIFVQAPGLTTGLSATGDTAGVSIAGKTNVKFKLSQNNEWFTSPTNNFGVILTLGKFYDVNGADAGGECNIKLLAVVTPTSAAPTAYTVPLSSFGVIQSCGVGGLDVASALALSPLSQVDFQAVGSSNPLPPVGGKLVGANMSVSNGGSPAVYPTTIAVTGGITID